VILNRLSDSDLKKQHGVITKEVAKQLMLKLGEDYERFKGFEILEKSFLKMSEVLAKGH